MDIPIQELVGSTGTIVGKLEANPIIGHEYDRPRFPLYWQSFTHPTLDEQWFKTLVTTADFQKSHFGINTEKEEIRVYDDTVRQSFVFRKPMPELNKATKGYLAEWAGEPEDSFTPSQQWNILRYNDGFFAWHKDKVRPVPGYQHLGTQLAFPPLEYSRFQNGDLVVLETNNQEIKLRPVEGQWLFIVLPLGYFHCVEKVKGTRYSFTKEIYFKLPQGTAEVQEKPKEQTSNK